MKRFEFFRMTLTGKLAVVFVMLLTLVIANTAIIYLFQASQQTDAAIVDAAGRDRMLSQRIGLLAEQVLLGHEEVRPLLREMIDLHNTSFLALRDGGIAPGIADDQPLPSTNGDIRPLADQVEELWQDYKRNAEIVANEPRLESGQPSPRALEALEFLEMNAAEMLLRNDNLTKAYVADNGRKQQLFNLALLIILIINAAIIALGFAVARSLVRALQVVDKAKTEFVSLASHQLLTPLTAAKWNTEMLANGDFGPLNPDQRSAVAELDQTNRQMRSLVNSFLNLSRIEMGAFLIEPETTDFVKVCESVLEELRPQIIEKNHTIDREFGGRLPLVPADPNLLRIIFQNFLSNAVKYTKNNGHITIKISADTKEITASVANSGEPIPESDQAKIFSKLFRASNAHNYDPNGNGLGLYLVREIVKNAGGRVWFESKPGQDTVFSATFPLSGMKRKTGTKTLA